MPTALVSHPSSLLHEMGAGHPECPERLRAIETQLKAEGLFERLLRFEAPTATREQLERVHRTGHIDAIFARAPKSGYSMIDGDTIMNPATLEAALHAAGALVLATDLVISGKARNAFCAVRPPGHHAEHDAAMGFCFFNNVAVGAAHALSTGLTRVAILDFDVHHGNGTEDIFADDPRVMFCSSFQHPLYPGRARPSVPGRRVNTPLPAGAGSEEFRAAVTQRWLPEIEQFRPEMLFVSAGFDAHRDDPLASLCLEDDDYSWITQQITDLAGRHCNGRIVSTLEGGYDLGAVGRCAALHLRGLMEG
jgi:acetoin utilization deacetylase AcuC-like enzyme